MRCIGVFNYPSFSSRTILFMDGIRLSRLNRVVFNIYLFRKTWEFKAEICNLFIRILFRPTI